MTRTFLYVGESTRYATTQTLIDQAHEAHKAGYLDLPERNRLIEALRSGELVHPVWEDYGLHTAADGTILRC